MFHSAHTQEPVLQSAAFKVIVKFLLHMHGQWLALCSHHSFERRVMPLDDLVEERLLWAPDRLGGDVYKVGRVAIDP